MGHGRRSWLGLCLVAAAGCWGQLPVQPAPCDLCPDGYACGSDDVCHLLCNGDRQCEACDVCQSGMCWALDGCSPDDAVPPLSTSGLGGEAIGRDVTLGWTLPDSEDFAEVIIVRYDGLRADEAPLKGRTYEPGADFGRGRVVYVGKDSALEDPELGCQGYLYQSWTRDHARNWGPSEEVLVQVGQGAPAPPVSISGPTAACAGQQGVTYSVPAVAGATSYTWIPPNGGSVTSGQGTPTAQISFGSGSGTVSVSASSFCGVGPSIELAVHVGLPAPVVSGPTDVCGYGEATYSVAPVAGASGYAWSLAGGEILSGQGTESVTVRFGPSVAPVVASALGSCGQSSPAALQIAPEPWQEVGEPGAIGFVPSRISHDAQGRIYVGDQRGSVVRLDDMAGTGWTRFGSKGTGPGQFLGVSGLDVTADGVVFVADFDGHRLSSFDGDMTGSGWTTTPAPGTPGALGTLQAPNGLAVDSQGRIYFAEQYQRTVLRFDDLSGAGWTQFGSGNGSGGTGDFAVPSYVAVDDLDRVYVTDSAIGAPRVIQFDPDDFLGSFASHPLTGCSGSCYPGAIAVDDSYRVYVTVNDTGYNRVRQITPTPNFATGSEVAYGGAYGGGVGTFNGPGGLAVDSSDRIYVSDVGNRRLVRFDDMTGAGWTEISVEPDPPPGLFTSPVNVTLGADGSLFVADQGNARIVHTGAMSLDGWETFGSRGTGAGQLANPADVVPDPNGGFFILDTGNHRVVHIDDWSGAGWQAFGSPAASCVPSGQTFCYPAGMALGTDGSVYVVDTHHYRVVKLSYTSGVGFADWQQLGTLGVGDLQFGGYGLIIYGPVGIALDADDRIYVADTDNRRIVRFDDMSGTNWTELATFGRPEGIVVSALGHIYYGDSDNARVVRVDDMSGAGFSSFGTRGSGPGQLNTLIANNPVVPFGLDVDARGFVYAADNQNHRIARVCVP